MTSITIDRIKIHTDDSASFTLHRSGVCPARCCHGELFDILTDWDKNLSDGSYEIKILILMTNLTNKSLDLITISSAIPASHWTHNNSIGIIFAALTIKSTLK